LAKSPTAILDRREQLLDAAVACFADQGYAAAKVSDIVQRAGVAQGTFYLYFKSKREVLVALVERFCQTLLEAGGHDERLPADPDAYRAQVLARNRRVLRVAVDQRRLAAVFFTESVKSDPELSGQLRRFHGAMTELTKKRLREAIDLGLIRPVDVDVVAYAINGMWEGAITHCVLLNPGTPDVDRLAESIVSLQLDGLRPRRS
jgi:AcrR family transcriptional regulator